MKKLAIILTVSILGIIILQGHTDSTTISYYQPPNTSITSISEPVAASVPLQKTLPSQSEQKNQIKQLADPVQIAPTQTIVEEPKLPSTNRVRICMDNFGPVNCP